ncbi:hypothetical protein [Psychromonas sp. KJ10-2]|uniref:hypothetical protein n=1 Tax=Psychromonas sp. KJ10-2 TaxID=3391822 RepID=UPI0039B3D88C
MKNKNLKEYLELKNLIKERHYKDYPLNKVVGSYLGMMVWKPSLKLYIDYLFLNPNNIKLSDSENIIYTYSTKRESYIDLIKAYFPSALPQYVRIKNSTKGKVLGFIPSFLSIVKGFQFTKEIECSFSQRLKLATVFSISFKIIDQLEKRKSNVRST